MFPAKGCRGQMAEFHGLRSGIDSNAMMDKY